MTSETPCPPGCREWPTYPSNGIGWANSDGVSVTHVPNCPNAKPAEPPACLPGCRPVYSVRIMSGPIQGDQIDHWPNCPNAPKPAVCPACRFHPTAEPPSEPPIDHRDLAVQIVDAIQGFAVEFAADPGHHRGLYALTEDAIRRRHESIKAERDALKASIHGWISANAPGGWIDDLRRENAALKARMEELSESLLWATSSYEERVVILANREKRKEQEASNGK